MPMVTSQARTSMAALSTYRHLLRSTRIAFEGDQRILHAARQTVRQKFNAERTLAPQSEEAKACVRYAEEVALVLRKNVVQGEKVEEGKYQLRIHLETERGDNDTIKTDGKWTGAAMASCCSGGGEAINSTSINVD